MLADPSIRRLQSLRLNLDVKKPTQSLLMILAFCSWASQFKYMYCHIGPPITN